MAMPEHRKAWVRAAAAPRRRALLIPALMMATALVAGCGGPTEPTIVSVPADKVPPKAANPVPTGKKHGPRYGVSPRIDPGAQKG